MRIGVHGGSFHGDETTAAAVLLALYPEAEIVRTRDKDVLAGCDFVVDVGGEFNPEAGLFDHHQKGFAERRNNGMPYAAAGLVWATHGPAFVRLKMPALSEAQALEVAAAVDTLLVRYLDAVDSGVSVESPPEFGLAMAVSNFNGTWCEPDGSDDDRFAQAVALMGAVLTNLVRHQGAEVLAQDVVRKAATRGNGRILVLDTPRLPYDRYVCEEMPDVLFVVYPESRGQQYQVRVALAQLGTFNARADLPAVWAGLRDEALAALTGVQDAVFCHNGRFICGAQSLEGAIRLAELALEDVTRGGAA